MTAAPPDARAVAWIDGAPAPFDIAILQAARLLAASSAPLFAHLGADMEGARQAILLAEHIGGILDHAASAAMLADLDAVRESGAMLTTPLEAAARADVVWLIGDAVFEAWPDLESRLLARSDIRVVWTRTSASPSTRRQAATVVDTGAGVERLAFLASLRARVKRPAAKTFAEIENVATMLRGAKFGIAVWSAAELEPLAIEAINGLVRDLNETTRFSTLPLTSADNGAGVQTTCGWMTGFPLRTGFPRGAPDHDPWRYDARRLVAAGEADCVIWVSAFENGAAPERQVDLALCAPGSPATARVRIDVARPGVDRDAILHDARVGGLVARTASARTKISTVGEALAAIRAELGGPPC